MPNITSMLRMEPRLSVRLNMNTIIVMSRGPNTVPLVSPLGVVSILCPLAHVPTDTCTLVFWAGVMPSAVAMVDDVLVAAPSRWVCIDSIIFAACAMDCVSF